MSYYIRTFSHKKRKYDRHLKSNIYEKQMITEECSPCTGTHYHYNIIINIQTDGYYI